jgi:hypothetical protein
MAFNQVASTPTNAWSPNGPEDPVYWDYHHDPALLCGENCSLIWIEDPPTEKCDGNCFNKYLDWSAKRAVVRWKAMEEEERKAKEEVRNKASQEAAAQKEAERRARIRARKEEELDMILARGQATEEAKALAREKIQEQRRKRGAPLGNFNALKNGFYSERATPEDLALLEKVSQLDSFDLSPEANFLRVKIANASANPSTSLETFQRAISTLTRVVLADAKVNRL